MKKLLILLTILPLLFFSTTAFAQTDSNQTQKTTLANGEVVNKDYFAANGIVEVSGTVNGDVYVFGGTILVDGIISGDLIAAGGTITISGQVSQNVRVAGGQVILSGKVGRSVSVAGGNINITNSASIGGSAAIAGGNITLSSPVEGGVKVAGGNVTISNSIGKDLESYSGQTRLTSKANIGGNFTYWSDNDATVDSGAKIVGETIKNAPMAKAPEPTKFFGVLTGFALFLKVISVVSTFVLGLLFVLFLRGFTKNTLGTLRQKAWPSLGVGFVALFITPIVAVILAITLVGIPLTLILLPLYFIAIYLSRLAVVFWVGQEIFKRTNTKVNDVVALLVGLVVYEIVTLIPIIGGITTFLVILFGLGAALITLRKSPASAVSPKLSSAK